MTSFLLTSGDIDVVNYAGRRTFVVKVAILSQAKDLLSRGGHVCCTLANVGFASPLMRSLQCHPSENRELSAEAHPAARHSTAVYYSPTFVPTNSMLNTHKRAMSEIKSGHQRVKKAQEECDKLKEKLKKAQARLAAEKRRLAAYEKILES